MTMSHLVKYLKALKSMRALADNKGLWVLSLGRPPLYHSYRVPLELGSSEQANYGFFDVRYFLWTILGWTDFGEIIKDHSFPLTGDSTLILRSCDKTSEAKKEILERIAS